MKISETGGIPDDLNIYYKDNLVHKFDEVYFSLP